MLARRKLGQPFQSELVPHLCTAPSRTRRKWPASQGTHSTPGWRYPYRRAAASSSSATHG